MGTLESGDRTLILSNTARTTALQFARLLCQGLVMVLSLRLLGTEGFGLISAIVAMSLVVSPLAGIGCDFVAMRASAREPTLAADAFRMGLRQLALTSLPLLVATVVAAYWWFAELFSLPVVLLLLVAEYLFLRGNELIAKILQGRGEFTAMALVRLSNSAARLLVLAPAAVVADTLSPLAWAWFYLGAGVLSAAYALAVLLRRLRGTGSGGARVRPDAVDGLHFAGGIISARISSELDKTLVLGLAGAASAGIYAASHRVVTWTVVPVTSFVSVTIGSLFRLSHDSGTGEVARRSVVHCLAAVVYGAMTGLALWFLLPPFVALVARQDSIDLGAGLLPLALLPAAMSTRLVGEQSLAAMERLGFRTKLQWSVAIASLALNVALIPRFGWAASAWIGFAAEGLLAVAYLAVMAASSDAERGREAVGRG